jgi:hypothetical protein
MNWLGPNKLPNFSEETISSYKGRGILASGRIHFDVLIW